MKNFIKMIFAVTLFSTACVGDLDVIPIDPNIETTATVYNDPESYTKILAKLYGGYSLTGQEGPFGQGDIAGVDEGESAYLRGLWYLQEFPTDEAVVGWGDKTIKDLHWHVWTQSDVFIQGFYYRVLYQITFANEFLRQTTDEKLDERGNVSSDLRAEIQYYRAEARFLRAWSYWHALDMFGNVPFVTENDAIGAFLPNQISRADLFDYIESELLAIESDLKAPKSNLYGRADQGAHWMLMAKLYLNAEVYTGTPRYTEAITYLDKVIAAGYTLAPDYQENFLADNHESPEIIFSINFDGVNSQSYNITTTVTHAAVGGTMSAAEFGIDGGWSGFRTTPEFVSLFDDVSGETDTRAMFHTDGQNLEIAEIPTFTEGYAIKKWKNVDKEGNPGSNGTFVDIDFPVFRLADAYLMYAEAVLRGGSGGSAQTALGYINQLRQRAYGDASGNITSNDLTIDFILDERGRELYWEGHRRTDLIRYQKFSGGNYIWAWKGNVAGGVSTSSHLDLFPIPSSDLAANPNLEQNDGY